VGVVFALLQTVKMAVPKWAATKVGQRLMPLIPIALGVVGAVAGLSSATTWGDKIALGVIAGFAAGQGFKVGKTTLLGKGIETASAAKTPAAPPDDEGEKGD
jgi:hypothetical protein